VKPTDEALLQQFYYRLGEHNRFLRFMEHKSRFSHEETQQLVNIDYEFSMMIVGLAGDEDAQEIVCVGSYYRDAGGNTGMAEVAASVGEAWQGQGLGREVFVRLIEVGRRQGVTGFSGEVMTENAALLRIVRSLPYRIVFRDYGETLEFSFMFGIHRDNDPESDAPDTHMNLKNPIS
jgi:GNAT superfamily N-acetyltransferase